MTRWCASLWALVCLMLAMVPAWAYPDRPVTLVVAFDQGGSTDFMARQLAPFLARHLGPGVQVEVVNRPGASGEVGFAAIADAVPDGHTLGFVNTPNVVAIPIERRARYTLDRLDPLVNVAEDPAIWAVRADSPYGSLASVLEAARARPGQVSFASTGVGSDDHLALQMIERLTGVRFLHRPYPGSAAAHQAMMAGVVAVCGENLGDGVRSRQSGAVRLLGVMTAQRRPVAPEVPTFVEQGLAVVMTSQRGIAAPQGLPGAVREQLVTALLAALADPEYVAQAEQAATYQPLRVLGSEAFAAELRRHDAILHALWRKTPWAVD